MEPALRRIHHPTVARSCDCACLLEGAIRILDQLHFPGQSCFCEPRAHQASQPAAVRHRAVQVPGYRCGASLGQRVADMVERWFCLGHVAVGAMYAGEIAVAAVDTAQHHCAAERGLYGDQAVEAVDSQPLPRKLAELDATRSTLCHGEARAASASQRDALTL